MKIKSLLFVIIPIHFLTLGNTPIKGVNSFNQNPKIISKWDFIGIWNYASNKESLNISTSCSSDSIRIVWNSVSNDYTEIIFENCLFENGKIYADYYGAKRNFIVELKNDQLLLTIDPFHEFRPIFKQPFQRSLKYVFKYINPSKNSIIHDGQKNIDSLPSGDRLVVKLDNKSTSDYSTFIYKNRFNRISSTKKKNWFIPAKNTSDIKPLFAGKEVLLQNNTFQTLNKSENFIVTILGNEKITQFSEIVNQRPEQNVVGQQKIKVDEEIFQKLSINRLRQGHGDYFNFFINGTVDLSPNFNSIVIDKQADAEYHRFLVNYDDKGNYLDHILIGFDDYIESFSPIKTIFSAGEIFVNYYVFSSDFECQYLPYKTERYILDINGRFLSSNYEQPLNQQTEKSIKILSQNIENTSNENATIDIYLNYIDTVHIGFVTSMHTVIKDKEGLETFVPFDLSEICGNYSPPYGDFYPPTGALQKLFHTIYPDGFDERLKIKLQLLDLNNNGNNELLMSIEDDNYINNIIDYLCFICKGDTWIYYSKNEEINDLIQYGKLNYLEAFKKYLNTNSD